MKNSELTKMLLQPQGVHLALMIPSTMMIKAINGVAKAIKSDDPQEIETIKDISKVVPGNSTKTASTMLAIVRVMKNMQLPAGAAGHLDVIDHEALNNLLKRILVDVAEFFSSNQKMSKTSVNCQFLFFKR